MELIKILLQPVHVSKGAWSWIQFVTTLAVWAGISTSAEAWQPLNSFLMQLPLAATTACFAVFAVLTLIGSMRLQQRLESIEEAARTCVSLVALDFAGFRHVVGSQLVAPSMPPPNSVIRDDAQVGIVVRNVGSNLVTVKAVDIRVEIAQGILPARSSEVRISKQSYIYTGQTATYRAGQVESVDLSQEPLQGILSYTLEYVVAPSARVHRSTKRFSFQWWFNMAERSYRWTYIEESEQ